MIAALALACTLSATECRSDDARAIASAIDAAMASPLLDHAHDLSLHDPQMFVRRLLEWSWTPHEYALA